MSKPKYPCKQIEFYAAAKIGLNSFKRYIDKFTNLKAKYTLAFFVAMLAKLKAAESMPDQDVRNAKTKEARNTLQKSAEQCRIYWQLLLSYLETAYKADVLPFKRQAAGGNYYAEAGDNNWEAVNQLMNDAVKFVEDNLADLTAGDNMPATFEGDLVVVFKKFQDDYEAFMEAEELVDDLGEDKVIATNECFDDLMQIFADGVKVFRDDEGKQKQFVFDHVLSLVSNKVASLGGKITTTKVGDELSGFVVRIAETGDEAVSDASGVYDFGSIKAETYTLEFSKVGYESQTLQNVEVKTGTGKTVNVVMVKL
jgi:hypothetical protein